MATAENTNTVDFNVGTAGDDADQWALFTAAAGGTRLWEASLTNNPAALTTNQFYRFAAGALVLTQPVGAGGATAPMAEKAADGMVAGGLYVELEDSADDSAFTNRVLVAEADWTVAQ